jgi:hypothetical protein
MHHYSAYGLAIASELECPELVSLPADVDIDADVTISLGTVAQEISEPRHVIRRIQIGDGIFQFDLEGIARYRVVAGHEIRIDIYPDAAPEHVRLYLLGTVFGALLHQLGRLPLHASAIAVDGCAFAFCGHSGAGKSTLAAALQRRGHALLCDDIGVVVPGDGGEPLFYPGFPRIKLWRDALEHFGINHGTLTRDWVRADKYHLQLQDALQQQPLPLHGVFFLQRGESGTPPAVHPLSARESIPLLVRHTYRPRLARQVGDGRSHFRQCAALAQQVAQHCYLRPWGLEKLDESLGVLDTKLSEHHP